MKKLVLFVVPGSTNSTIALMNLRKALERAGKPESAIEVVDVGDDPERIVAWRILVTPTLVWGDRPFEKRLIGDLSAEAELVAFVS
jgi:hypothetical protein